MRNIGKKAILGFGITGQFRCLPADQFPVGGDLGIAFPEQPVLAVTQPADPVDQPTDERENQHAAQQQPAPAPGALSLIGELKLFGLRLRQFLLILKAGFHPGDLLRILQAEDGVFYGNIVFISGQGFGRSADSLVSLIKAFIAVQPGLPVFILPGYPAALLAPFNGFPGLPAQQGQCPQLAEGAGGFSLQVEPLLDFQGFLEVCSGLIVFLPFQVDIADIAQRVGYALIIALARFLDKLSS